MTEIIIAKTALDNGPARAIFMTSVLGFRKFCSLNWTGFAHPNPAKIRKINPIRSMCFKGLSVTRPISFEVESPQR